MQEIDMINLFGSPAGRAINKITSIKLNKSDDEQKTKNHSNKINSSDANINTLNNDHQFGSVSTTLMSPVAFDSHKKASEMYSNLHKKKNKCWKLIENDKLNNNCSTSTFDATPQRKHPSTSPR